MKNFNKTMVFLGLCIFLFMVMRLGWKEIFQQLYLMGWGIFVIVLLRSCSQTFFALAWYQTFPKGQRKVPFTYLLKARLAGEALNYLVPSATMGGEPLKAELLKPYMNFSSGLASVTMAKYSFLLAQLILMVLGGILVLTMMKLSGALSFLIIFTLGLIGVGLGVLYYGQQRSLFSKLAKTLISWGIGKSYLSSRLKKIQELDRMIAFLYRNQKKEFFLSLLLNVIGWAEGILEIFLILYFLKIEPIWVTAFIIEALSLVINAAFFFVPWQLGTQETSKVFIFQICGLGPAAGFALGLIRRFREVIWAGIGLLCWASFGRKVLVRASSF